MIKNISLFVKYAEFFYKYLSIFFILISVLLGILRVFFRHLGLPGSAIISELALVSLTWAVLMGIAWQVSTRGHLKIDVIYDKLPFFWKRMLSLIFSLFISYVGYLMIREGMLYVESTRISSAMATSLRIPRWITFYLPLPIAGLGVFIFGLRQIVEVFSGINNK